jgi:hypothetical protein
VYSWGLDVDLAIFPVIDEDDPAGINRLERNQLSIYPNPCFDQLVILDSEIKSGQLRIFDATGRQTKAMQYSQMNRTLDVSNLQAGIYSIAITDGAIQWSSKFIKAN